MSVIGVSVLGATGSVGSSTLDVIARHPDKYRVSALTAAYNVDAMTELCLRFRPQLAAMSDETSARELARRLAGSVTEVVAGDEGLFAAAEHDDSRIVMAAITGAAGLTPTMAAVRAGKRVLLANKEALVMAGRLFMEAVSRHGATLLPIDSEHNALFQCLPAASADWHSAGVSRLLLTGSGGPFRCHSMAELESVTPDQACAHPTWQMGRKISVDSATLMNKGLELIEAHWLFDMPADRIDVVIHPQSVIHSLVQYVDGSVLAQMGNPDMRTPIAHALAWPQRIEAGVAGLDLFQVARLDFEPADLDRFPCLRLAREALAAGGSAPAVLNAANEVAVAAFLAGRLGFTRIAEVCAHALARVHAPECRDFAELLAVDRETRQIAENHIAEIGR